MKKFLLLTVAMTAAVSASALVTRPQTAVVNDRVEGIKIEKKNAARVQAKADEAASATTYEYTLAVDPSHAASAYTLGSNASAGNMLYQCFKISKEAQKPYIGAKITAFHLTAGRNGSNSDVNSNTQVCAFLSTDISKAMDVRKMAKISREALSYNTIKFDEPYVITGETDIYAGYYFKISSASGYYLTVDALPTNAESLIVGYINGITMPTNWTNFANQIGSGCMAVTIDAAGTDVQFPVDCMQVAAAELPVYVKSGEPVEYNVAICNRGVNTADNIKLVTETGNGQKVETIVELTEDCPTNGIIELGVKAMVMESDGIFTLSATVPEVNGKPNTMADAVASGEFSCYTSDWKHVPVIEEGTGTWCGWCPSGIVLLDNMKHKYGDDFARIAVHNGDEMALRSYQGLVSDYFTGFPSAIVNRMYSVAPSGYEPMEIINELYDFYDSYPAYVDIDLESTVAEDGKSVTIDATTEFAFDTDTKHLLSFVLTADKVGPYDQHNYYAGGGNMMPWGGYADVVSTLFDDVAMNIKSYPGITNSIPAQIEKGVKYPNSQKLSISNIKTPWFKIIAMVTNAKTGEIVNSKVFRGGDWSGVESVAADSEQVNISINGNVVNVSGAKNVRIFSLDGRMVSDRNSTVLPAGVYVVKADGKTVKAMVR